MSGRIIPSILEKGVEISRNWATPWSFDSVLELSWHLWVCHFICGFRIKVLSAILVPFDSNKFMLSLGYVILLKVMPCPEGLIG